MSPFDLLDPVNALRQLDARDLDDVPESALSDGTLLRLAQSATEAEPSCVWAWQQRAHLASFCALMSVDRARAEVYWDDAMTAVEALGKLDDRQVYEAVLVDTVAHATGLKDRYDAWAARHDVARLLLDLQHVRLARDPSSRPNGWGYVGEAHLRARRID